MTPLYAAAYTQEAAKKLPAERLHADTACTSHQQTYFLAACTNGSYKQSAMLHPDKNAEQTCTKKTGLLIRPDCTWAGSSWHHTVNDSAILTAKPQSLWNWATKARPMHWTQNKRPFSVILCCCMLVRNAASQIILAKVRKAERQNGCLCPHCW